MKVIILLLVCFCMHTIVFAFAQVTTPAPGTYTVLGIPDVSYNITQNRFTPSSSTVTYQYGGVLSAPTPHRNFVHRRFHHYTLDPGASAIYAHGWTGLGGYYQSSVEYGWTILTFSTIPSLVVGDSDEYGFQTRLYYDSSAPYCWGNGVTMDLTVVP